MLFDLKTTNVFDKIDDSFPLNNEVENFITAVNPSPQERRVTAAFARGNADGTSTKNSNPYIEVDTVTRLILKNVSL